MEDAARVEVRDREAFLLQLADGLLLERLKLGNREHLVEYILVNHTVITSTSTALTTTLSSRGSPRP